MLCGEVCAQVLGTQGSVYPIYEQDALAFIEKRLFYLQSIGAIKAHQERLKTQALRTLEVPKAVSNLQETTKPRVFEKDITVVVAQDIRDAEGHLIQKAGTRINPLKKFISKKALLFLDGDNPKQVAWALLEHERSHGLCKMILVKGPVLQLMREHERSFYFDQNGRLVQYFSIRQIPAKVTQRQDKLLIEELKL